MFWNDELGMYEPELQDLENQDIQYLLTPAELDAIFEDFEESQEV